GTEVKLYAVWKLKEGAGYRITFNSNVDNNVEANGIPSDDEITEKTKVEGVEGFWYTLPSVSPVRKGYTFKGWAAKATETDSAKIYVAGNKVEIKTDTTFYAQWEINPTVSYIANGGTFAEGKEIQTASYAAGSTVLVVNPREIDEETPAILTRTGYTFVGWSTSDISGDTEIYGKANSEGAVSEFTFKMPQKSVVFKAKWIKNVYRENVIADSDAYKISYTGSYSDEEDGTTKNTELASVKLTKGETISGESTTDYVGNIENIPHDADLTLMVKVDSTYKADDIIVKVNDAEYKPVSIEVETVKEPETGSEGGNDPEPGEETIIPEDGKGATTLTYKISGITSNDFGIKITGAVKKTFNINYVSSIGTIPDDKVTSYTAGGSTVINVTPTESTNKYTFAGWYLTADDAKNLTAVPVTAIGPEARGNKTLYAAWNGKNYTVTFNKLYGTNGSTNDTNTQELSFGEEEALKAFSVLFPETTGPNGAEFLGWALSEEAAIAHKVTYTDGQKVVDISEADDPKTEDKDESAITLYAVWDITKVNITFDANGGKFTGDKQTEARQIDYATSPAAIFSELESQEKRPVYPGFTFKGWSTNKDASSKDTYPEKQSEDATYYAVWDAGTTTFTYYDNDSKVKKTDTVTYGTEVTIGKVKNEQNELVDVLESTDIPEGKVLIGWHTSKATQNPNNEITFAQGEKITVSTTNAVPDLHPVFGDTNKHVLTYNLNGGKFEFKPEVQELEKEENKYSKTIIGTKPVKEGYVFAGWAEDAEATYESQNLIQAGETYEYIEPAEDIVYSHVLYAIWKPVTYKVIFNAGKVPVAAADIINKDAADKGTPVLKEKLDENLVVVEETSDSQEPADSTTTTAKAYAQTFTYGVSAQFADPQFDYPGYTFKGWSDKADSTEVVYKNRQAVLNMVDEMDEDAEGKAKEKELNVYAVWA
ncbi:MAG TPA: hypothetical protein DEO83_07360, partial [Lachnospiraceae bacterium]|nr:hypothetical protein [Lachnospiraceae bacterium]